MVLLGGGTAPAPAAPAPAAAAAAAPGAALPLLPLPKKDLMLPLPVIGGTGAFLRPPPPLPRFMAPEALLEPVGLCGEGWHILGQAWKGGKATPSLRLFLGEGSKQPTTIMTTSEDEEAQRTSNTAHNHIHLQGLSLSAYKDRP
jgi:hypothetical protein